MGTITALAAALAAVVIAAGVAKIVRPQPTVAAFLATRWPFLRRGGRSLARLIGAAEVLLGAATLVIPGRWAGLALAGAYLAFTVVTARLLVVAPAADCGCFGDASSPVHPLHLAINLAGVVVGIAAAVIAGPSVPVLAAGSGWGAGTIFVLLTTALAVALYAAYTALPDLLTARQKLEAAT